MKFLQGGELEVFLLASKQAYETLEVISKSEQPSTSDLLLLAQYDALERLYGGEAFRKLIDRARTEGLTTEEHVLRMVREHQLLARASEIKLGLGISYGRCHGLLEKHADLFLPRDYIPGLKAREEYPRVEEFDLNGLLALVNVAPVMIEVPSELVEYGIALGLDREHPHQMTQAFGRVREYFRERELF